MLTGDLVRPRLYRQGERILVKHLDINAPHWQQTAVDLIGLLHQHVGLTFADWEAALTTYEGDRTDYEVVRGLAKVLTDAASFEARNLPVEPSELRQRLFSLGPVFADETLFQPTSRDSLLAQAAKAYALEQETLEASLYADRPAAYHLVEAGPDWTTEALLARYNLELARGVLYWARQMEVEIHDTYKDFWRYVKLFKLMHWATPLPDGGYRVILDGPISPFVQSSTRYGRQMAAFLPALLLCQQWRMQSDIRMSHFEQELRYELDASAELPSTFKRSGLFDSKLEESFAAAFHVKFGETRQKWDLRREDEVLLLGDTVFIPDFTLTNVKDGRRALIEIMGFWHPDYLKRKLAKVRAANRSNLILLIYEGVNLGKERLQNVPNEVLYFAKRPILKDVLAAVERVAE